MLQTNGTAPSRSRHRTFAGSACFSQPPRVSTRTPEAPDLPRRPAKQNLHFVAPLAGWISIAGKSEPPQPAEKATTNTSNSPHIRVRRLLFVYVLWMWGVPHLQNTQLSYDGYAPAVTSCKINRFSMATAPAVTNRHSGLQGTPLRQRSCPRGPHLDVSFASPHWEGNDPWDFGPQKMVGNMFRDVCVLQLYHKNWKG